MCAVSWCMLGAAGGTVDSSLRQLPRGRNLSVKASGAAKKPSILEGGGCGSEVLSSDATLHDKARVLAHRRQSLIPMSSVP